MHREHITLNGKTYDIRIGSGRIDISTTWEIPHPSDAGLVHPRMVHRYANISPYGRLGTKILKALPVEAQALIHGIF